MCTLCRAYALPCRSALLSVDVRRAVHTSLFFFVDACSWSWVVLTFLLWLWRRGALPRVGLLSGPGALGHCCAELHEAEVLEEYQRADDDEARCGALANPSDDEGA